MYPLPNWKVVHHNNQFQWFLQQLVRKLMMMIIKLQLKLLQNLVGQPKHDPHCSVSHVTWPWWTYKLWRNYDEPKFWQMAWGHEIWDRIHIWEQSMDFGWLARWSASHRKINGSSRERRTLIVVLLSTKLDLLKKVLTKFKVLTTMSFLTRSDA